MRLSVKVLGGSECNVEAKEDTTVEELKAEIEAKLKLGKAEQKLLFKGKALQDGTNLGAYSLVDGSKLNLIVKREATTTAASVPKLKPEDSSVEGLDEVLLKSIRKHFRTEAEAKKVVSVFMTVSCVGLPRYENIEKNYCLFRTSRRSYPR